MRSRLLLGMVLVLAFGAGCGDDSPDETRSGDSTGTTSTTGPDTPVGSPDGGSPDGGSPPPTGGTLPGRPADLVGVVTDSEGGRVLVEEQPDAPDAGRKAWVAIEGPVFARSGDGDPAPAEPSDVEVGRRVSAWTGICAESYPEQCAAEALVLE